MESSTKPQLTTEQFKQLQAARQKLIAKGFSGNELNAQMAEITKLVTDPAYNARVSGNSKAPLGAPLSNPANDWSKLSGYEKMKAIRNVGMAAGTGALLSEVPKTWHEGLGDAAMIGGALLFPEEEAGGSLVKAGMKMAGRIGLPALVAGGTAAATGDDPTDAALQTAGQAALGEGIGAGINLPGRKSARALQNESVAGLGDWIMKNLPHFKNPRMPDFGTYAAEESPDLLNPEKGTNPETAVATRSKGGVPGPMRLDLPGPEGGEPPKPNKLKRPAGLSDEEWSKRRDAYKQWYDLQRALKIKTNADLFRAFDPASPNNAPKRIGTFLGRVTGELRETFKGAAFTVPSLDEAIRLSGGEAKPTYSFADATNQIERLNRMAYTYSGDPQKKAVAAEIRRSLHFAIGELGEEMDLAVPGAGSFYTSLRREEAGALLLQRILGDEKSKVWSGLMDVTELQRKLLSQGDDGYAADMNRVFGPGPTNELRHIILHGGEPGAGVDNPKAGILSRLRFWTHGVGEGIGVSLGGAPLAELQPRYAGNPRRYGKIPHAIPGLLAGPGPRAVMAPEPVLVNPNVSAEGDENASGQ